MNFKIKILAFLFFLAISVRSGMAQDPHLSQYFASPVLLNPAKTGMFGSGEYRTVANYRSQWSAVASDPYTTTALSFDMPLKERWGVGGAIVNNDDPSILNVLSGVVTGAYQVMDPSQDEHWLTVGLRAGVINKSTKKEDLLFDQQYNGGVFNPNLPSGENLEHQSVLMPELGLGVNYRMNKSETTLDPYGGFAVYHITSPIESFTATNKARLPRRYVLHGGTRIKATDRLRVDPRFLAMKQGTADEINVGGQVSYELGENGTTRPYLGGFYRFDDAVILMTGVRYEQMLFRMSYDINTSGLESYSAGRGGWEFSLIYHIDHKEIIDQYL